MFDEVSHNVAQIDSVRSRIRTAKNHHPTSSVGRDKAEYQYTCHGCARNSDVQRSDLVSNDTRNHSTKDDASIDDGDEVERESRSIDAICDCKIPVAFHDQCIEVLEKENIYLLHIEIRYPQSKRTDNCT